MIEMLEWLGALLGIVGSLLLASNSQYSRWGFVAYLVSNICLIVFAVVIQAVGIATMYTLYTVIAIYGVIQWFPCKRREQIT